MIESEIVAPGSVKGVLSGKNYNRCLRLHKIIYKAMEKLRLEASEETLSTAEKAFFESIYYLLQDESATKDFFR